MGLLPCPEPPDWSIDWPALDQLPWIAAMRGCPQNPSRHAEGDVWTHVHMVCEAMAQLPAWQELPDRPTAPLLFHAALLHDVAKPACTRVETDGSISSRGHAWKGAVRARQILWRRGLPFAVPRADRRPDPPPPGPLLPGRERRPGERLAIEVSHNARCDWLSILAEADARGRICPDPDRTC